VFGAGVLERIPDEAVWPTRPPAMWTGRATVTTAAPGA
jgi:hypothetical protein